MRKSRDYYTLDSELYKKFIEYIEKNNWNKSKIIETLIKDFVNKDNKKE